MIFPLFQIYLRLNNINHTGILGRCMNFAVLPCPLSTCLAGEVPRGWRCALTKSVPVRVLRTTHVAGVPGLSRYRVPETQLRDISAQVQYPDLQRVRLWSPPVLLFHPPAPKLLHETCTFPLV